MDFDDFKKLNERLLPCPWCDKTPIITQTMGYNEEMGYNKNQLIYYSVSHYCDKVGHIQIPEQITPEKCIRIWNSYLK